MVARRRMRWRDVPEGFRRLYRDPSNLAGVAAGAATGAAVYFIGDGVVNHIMNPSMGVSAYAELNNAMQYLRTGLRAAEVAVSVYAGWKAGNKVRDSVRYRFPRA